MALYSQTRRVVVRPAPWWHRLVGAACDAWVVGILAYTLAAIIHRVL